MISRLILLPVLISGLIFSLTGCEEAPDDDVNEVQWDDWDGNDGVATTGNGDDEEVITDDYYEVIDKRSAGGKMYDDPGETSFDGQPVQRREPMEYMIVVRGNNTRQESAYLLPASDFNQVRVGHRLREGTLARWESTGTNHIPPDAPSEPQESEVRDIRSPFDSDYERF